MSPKVPQLKKQQLDLIDKSLRSIWVLAIGAALVLIGFVYLLSLDTPPPLGETSSSQSESAAQ
jgi:hypothetical protein